MTTLLVNYIVNFPQVASKVSTTDWMPADDSRYKSASTVLAFSGTCSLNGRITELLNEYSQLTTDWNQDDDIAPDKSAIHQASFLASLLAQHGQAIFHASPGPAGEIMLELRNKRNTKAVEIIFYPTRSVIVFFPASEKPGQQPFRWEELPSYLEWLNERNPTYPRNL